MSKQINIKEGSLENQDTHQNIGWVDTVSGMSELEALIDMKARLDKLEATNDRNLEKHMRLVMEVDQISYPRSKRVTHNYLTKLKRRKVLKRDVQVVTYTYHRQLYLVYTQMFDVMQTQKKRKFNTAEIALFLARYLNAIFMMGKWRYFDDQSLTFGVWGNVHKVIRVAEELAVMNKNVLLYPFQIKDTSIATILKRGFMVDTLRKGNYSQIEFELTDRILKIWATNPLIVNIYKEDHYQFYIALEGDRGPERLRGKERKVECYYWETARLTDLIEAYLCAVEMRKSVVEFGLETIASKPTVVKLLKKLRVDWCVEGYLRQRRTEERQARSSLLNMSYGIDAIHSILIKQQQQEQLESTEKGSFTYQLKASVRELKATMSDIDETLASEVSLAPESEGRWMVDESKSGFAIDYGRKVPAWVEVGVLVGYRETGYKKTFNVAEVKSVRKLANGTYRAGFKKISHNTAALTVSVIRDVAEVESSQGKVISGDPSMFKGILVDNDAMRAPKLLLPSEQFTLDSTYQIDLDGKSHQVPTGKVLQQQDGWVLFEAKLSN